MSKTAAEGVCKGMDPEGYSSGNGYVSCTLATKNEAACKAAGGQLSGYVCKIPYTESSNENNNNSNSNSSSSSSSSSKKPSESNVQYTGEGNGYSYGYGLDSKDTLSTSVLDCSDSGNGEGIFCILNIGLTVLTWGVGIAGTLGIVICGIQYLTARDSVDQAAKAKNRLINIIIGLAVYAVMWGFLTWLIPGGLF